jgi:outer membrane protein assembly factor BamE (lipoprotein component of BamABCDE complex)
MRTWITVATLAAALLLAAGCDEQRAAKLEEGVSTEADVRKQFGNPVDVYEHADGSRTLEYPRQPEGQSNYFITIGADGKMNALRQLLNAANFAKVQPGMSGDDVRKLLSRPAKVTPYALKQQAVWDWHYRDGQTNKVFSVTFDAQGRVVSSASADDPRDTQIGGK